MNRQARPAANWPAPIGAEYRPEDARPAAEPPLMSLTEMLGTVWRYRYALGLWIGLFLAAAAWYLHITPPEYSASATVILEPRRRTTAPQEGTASSYPPTLDSAQAESQIQVIRSERILAFVFDLLDLQNAPEFADHGPGLKERLLARLGMPVKSEPDTADKEAQARSRAFQAFWDRVSVRRIGQSYVLEVSYRAGSPGQAARIANAITSAYILAQIDLKAAAAHNGTEYLQGRIADIKAEQDAALDGVRQGRIPAIQFPDADARVIGAALRPLAKAFPQTSLVLIFALACGSLTGLFVIAVRHALDRTLKTRTQIRTASGIECLGSLPDVSRLREVRGRTRKSALMRSVVSHPDSRFSQGIRAARAAVFLSRPAERYRVLGLVSWSRGEGRTTVASNLAHLIAVSGEPVVLIDGDLRHPDLTASLAPGTPAGLSEALIGRTDKAEVNPVELSPGLTFIGAVAEGRVGDPNVYLGSAEMQSLLARHRAAAHIIIDLPPLGLSSDAQALGPFLDGVILIVEAGRTTIEDAADAVRSLRAANVPILGAVINKARLKRAK